MTVLKAVLGIHILISVWISSDALGQSQAADTQKQDPKTAKEADAAADDHAAGASQYSGAAIYARYCALCHGADRQGYAADEAPSLRSVVCMYRSLDSFSAQSRKTIKNTSEMASKNRYQKRILRVALNYPHLIN